MSFTSLTRDLHKSKSLIHAGRSSMSMESIQLSTDINSNYADIVADANICDAESEFEEISKITSQQQDLIPASHIHSVGKRIKQKTFESDSNVAENETSELNVAPTIPILIKSVGTVRQRYRLLQMEEAAESEKRAKRFRRHFFPKNNSIAITKTDQISRIPVLECATTPLVAYDIVLDDLDCIKVS